MGIDDKSSHPELCSGVADGVTRNMVCLFREPDAGNLPVRFDEREQETAPSQTGLRWRGESQVDSPPGDYSYCACSRLYSIEASGIATLVESLKVARDRGIRFHLQGHGSVLQLFESAGLLALFDKNSGAQAAS